MVENTPIQEDIDTPTTGQKEKYMHNNSGNHKDNITGYHIEREILESHERRK